MPMPSLSNMYGGMSPRRTMQTSRSWWQQPLDGGSGMDAMGDPMATLGSMQGAMGAMQKPQPMQNDRLNMEPSPFNMSGMEGMGAGGSAPIDSMGSAFGGQGVIGGGVGNPDPWSQWNSMPASTRAFIPEPRRGGIFGMYA